MLNIVSHFTEPFPFSLGIIHIVSHLNFPVSQLSDFFPVQNIVQWGTKPFPFKRFSHITDSLITDSYCTIVFITRKDIHQLHRVITLRELELTVQFSKLLLLCALIIIKIPHTFQLTELGSCKIADASYLSPI
jgi:hypothetical protein